MGRGLPALHKGELQVSAHGSSFSTGVPQHTSGWSLPWLGLLAQPHTLQPPLEIRELGGPKQARRGERGSRRLGLLDLLQPHKGQVLATALRKGLSKAAVLGTGQALQRRVESMVKPICSSSKCACKPHSPPTRPASELSQWQKKFAGLCCVADQVIR